MLLVHWGSHRHDETLLWLWLGADCDSNNVPNNERSTYARMPMELHAFWLPRSRVQIPPVAQLLYMAAVAQLVEQEKRFIILCREVCVPLTRLLIKRPLPKGEVNAIPSPVRRRCPEDGWGKIIITHIHCECRSELHELIIPRSQVRALPVPQMITHWNRSSVGRAG